VKLCFKHFYKKPAFPPCLLVKYLRILHSVFLVVQNNSKPFYFEIIRAEIIENVLIFETEHEGAKIHIQLDDLTKIKIEALGKES
jgi:hypothetical protein